MAPFGDDADDATSSDSGRGGIGGFTRTGGASWARRESSEASAPRALLDGELAQLEAMEVRLTRAVAEQTRVMAAFEASLAASRGGDGEAATAAVEARVAASVAAVEARLAQRCAAAEARAQAAEAAAAAAASDTAALAAQLAELRAALATSAPRAQTPAAPAPAQWTVNPLAPPEATPHQSAEPKPPAYTPHTVTLPPPQPQPPQPHHPAPHAGSSSASARAQAAAAEEAAMKVIDLINAKPHAPAAPYAVGTDPSPAAARAAAALAQARARIRSREGGPTPAAFGADTMAQMTRARQLLDSIGAHGGAAPAPAPATAPAARPAYGAAPLAGLLAAAGDEDLLT